MQVCVYTPTNWASTSFSTASAGGITGIAYMPDQTNCGAASDGYTLLGGASATLDPGAFGDSLAFVFRIGGAATSGGSALVTISTASEDPDTHETVWTPPSQAFKGLPIAPAGTSVYVANDASACGGNSPCYLNSGGDDDGGLGTGLKDAIDAQAGPITINVLGSYTLKSHTVEVNQPDLIKGVNNASITYNGSACSNPMLSLLAGATLSDLTINSGACSSPRRDLIVVNSPATVTLEFEHPHRRQ